MEVEDKQDPGEEAKRKAQDMAEQVDGQGALPDGADGQTSEEHEQRLKKARLEAAELADKQARDLAEAESLQQRG